MLTTKTWSRTNSTFKIFLRKQICARKIANMEILFLQKRKDWISEGSSCCQYALRPPLHLLATNLCVLGNTEWISTKVEFNLKLMVLKHKSHFGLGWCYNTFTPWNFIVFPEEEEEKQFVYLWEVVSL